MKLLKTDLRNRMGDEMLLFQGIIANNRSFNVEIDKAIGEFLSESGESLRINLQ